MLLPYFSNKQILLAIVIGSSVLVAALWILAFLTFPQDKPVAVLHYSTGIGIDYIGEGEQILVLPGAATLLLLTNLLLWRFVRRASVRAAWIFMGILPLLVALLLTAYILLWRLNS